MTDIIDSLRVQNYQSHRDSKFEFVRGINAFVGDSDAGKSAVLRALMNAINNDAPEVDYASRWVRKKDKAGKYAGFKADGFYKVTVGKGDRECSRIRSTSENGYQLTGHSELLAIGKQLPAEVTQFFNLTETNIHTQHEPQFLISRGGAEIARYFNRVIKLEIIDEQISAANSKKLTAGAAVQLQEAEIKKTQGELQSLSWVDTVEPLIAGVEAKQQALETMRQKSSRLITMLQELEMSLSIIKRLVVINEIPPRIAQASKLMGKMTVVCASYNRLTQSTIEHARLTGVLQHLSKLESVSIAHQVVTQKFKEVEGQRDRQGALLTYINSLRENTKMASIAIPVTRLQARVPRLEKMREEHRSMGNLLQVLQIQGPKASIEIPTMGRTGNRITRLFDMKKEQQDLRTLLARLTDSHHSIVTLTSEISALEAMLPSICPTCGQSIPNHSHGIA